MMPRALLALILSLALCAPVAAGDGHSAKGVANESGISVTGSWLRATLPNRPNAGYLKIRTQGDEGDRLIGARSEAFEAVEIHRTTMTDGVMSMEPVEAVDVPGEGEALLEPGGAHLMLFGGGALKEGERVTVTLIFERAGEIDVLFNVRRKAPGGHDH